MANESELIASVKAIIHGSDAVTMTENANKAADIIPTTRDLVAGAVSKHIALNEMLPPRVAKAHTEGDAHFHDLDYSPLFPMFNCMLIDIEGMLTKGFRLGNAEIETPKSISTATAVTAQIIAQVASHIYGGNTVDRMDEVLAPYVRASYDKHLSFAMKWLKGDAKSAAVMATEMTTKETYDAFQALEYEINTLHTANGQTPFCTFGFGLGTSWEARLIQKSILQVRIRGLGKDGKTAVFPKLVFAMCEGVNRQPHDPNYDIKQLALECSAKRLYPDILNYHKLVEVTGGFKTPMGCRSFLGEHNGIHAGRNNLGVYSLNLPRLAIHARGNMTTFYDALDYQLEVAKEALMYRIHRLDNVKAKVAPILYMEGACGVRLNAEDSVAEIFKHGRASISLGYIGLHEMASAMFPEGGHTLDDQRKQDFCEYVVAYLRRAVEDWKEETGYGFSLYSTPSESLCDRFCRLDIAKFGETPGVTDKGYYTNSFHLDVFKDALPSEKVNFESVYPKHASGGFISYVEFPNMLNNLKGLERVWDYTYDRLPYFGTNTPADQCGECGFKGEMKATEEGFQCPHCGCTDSDKIHAVRRVCGYLGAPHARPFNPGKQKEVIGRVKHVQNR